MRKFFQFIMVVLLSLGSCSEPVLDYNSEVGSEKLQGRGSNFLTPEEAITKASEAYTYFTGKIVSAISRSKVGEVYCISTPYSRSSKPDTIAYIVNYPDDSGYCIIASNPLISDNYIAFVDKGHLMSLEDIEVEPQRLYLNTILSNVAKESNVMSRVGKLDPIPMPIETIKVDSVYREAGEISNLNWAQIGIFGRYCDNGACGCVPLAMAITMAKFGSPASMMVNFSNNIKPSVTKNINFDWADIRKLHDMDDLGFIFAEYPSRESLDNISLLVRQLGEMASTEYPMPEEGKLPSSPTSKTKAKNLATKIFPNKTVKGYVDFDDPEIFENVLKTGIVVLTGKANDSKNGHTWIAEKYKYLSRTVHHYFDGVYSHTDHSVIKHGYMNWGEGGLGNGYYDLAYYKKSFYVRDFGVTYENIELLTIQ